MQNKDLMLQVPDKHYPFSFKQKDAFSLYTFNTIAEVGYTIVFKPSPYLFGEEKPYAFLLFEFSILAKFAGPQSYVRDNLIAPTIIAIFLDFFEKNNRNVSFYICDSSDGRQHVRKRKFDSWYDEYNRGAFIKLDDIIRDEKGILFPVSIIMYKQNPFLKEIAEAFWILVEENNKGKINNP